MTAIADIDDLDPLEAWLRETDQPLDACIALAHRAAMRVAPLVWVWASPVRPDTALTAIPIVRALLVSGLATPGAPPDVGAAALDAALAAADAVKAAYADASGDAAADSVANAAFAVDLAAVDKGPTGTRRTAALAADAAAYSAANAADAAAGLWAVLRHDCRVLEAGDRIDALPLWQEPVPCIESAWSRVREGWDAAGPGWRFWIDWYAAARAGRPVAPALLAEIALLDQAQGFALWKGDPALLNLVIAGIVARHPRHADPRALRK